MRVVVLADTHIADGSARPVLPDVAWRRLRRADVILHAGDVTGEHLLAELRRSAPVHAVLGNNDRGLRGVLPEVVEVELGGVRVAVVHDSGPRLGRERRMARRFPDARVVVFGHGHIPWNASGEAGQLLFNPGSATQRRRQPQRTFGVLDLRDGTVARAEIVAVPDRS